MPVTLADRAVSVGLWTSGLGWLVPMMTSMFALSMVVPPKKTDWLNRVYCLGQMKAVGARWRPVVDPAVDPNTPYMFAQNHVNLLDHVSLYPATPHFKQGLELESHFKIPVYGWFMKARGTIGVRGGKEGQTPEIMANMRREIDQGNSILAFPEGTRTLDGRVGGFRKGVFFIARDLGIPVVPVSVCGMYCVLRKGSAIMRRHEVTVFVDAPIPTAGVSDEGIEALAEQVRSVMAARVDAWWAEEAA